MDKHTNNRRKVVWGGKHFDFKDVFKCAYCGASVIGEEKFKLLKSGKKNRHVYYHCTKKIDPNCPEPYINKKDLLLEFIRFIGLIEKRKPEFFVITKDVKSRMGKYRAFRNQVLEEHNIDPINKPLSFSEYFKNIILNGTKEEKGDLLTCIKLPLYIHEGRIYASPIC